MATAKLNYSTQAKIESSPYSEGAIYVATDTKKIYVDLEGERLLLSPDTSIKEVTVSDDEPAVKTPIWVQTLED